MDAMTDGAFSGRSPVAPTFIIWEVATALVPRAQISTVSPWLPDFSDDGGADTAALSIDYCDSGSRSHSLPV